MEFLLRDMGVCGRVKTRVQIKCSGCSLTLLHAGLAGKVDDSSRVAAWGRQAGLGIGAGGRSASQHSDSTWLVNLYRLVTATCGQDPFNITHGKPRDETRRDKTLSGSGMHIWICFLVIAHVRKLTAHCNCPSPSPPKPLALLDFPKSLSQLRRKVRALSPANKTLSTRQVLTFPALPTPPLQLAICSQHIFDPIVLFS